MPPAATSSIDTSDVLSFALDEETSVLLAVRAQWPHISSRLQDRIGLKACVVSAVLKLEGVNDALITDMMMRHVRPWNLTCHMRTSCL